jgi:hypothetical protein
VKNKADSKSTTVVGTMRKIGLEGGIWACVTDDGTSWELLGAPDAMKKNGLRVEVDLDGKNADATIGMMGRSGRVKGWREL